MVRIKQNYFVFYFGNNNREYMTLVVAHLQFHTSFWGHVVRELAPRIFHHHIVIALSVSLVYRDVHSFLFADLHIYKGIIESFDNLTTSNFELKWIATFGAIES